MFSSRSCSIATQPMPPSLMMIFRSGCFTGVARPQPFRARAQRELAEQRRAERHHRRARRHVGDAGRADVQADHGVGLRARRDDRVPPRREDRFHADAVRHLGQRHRGEAARRVAADLRRALFGIGEVRDAHRHDAVGMRRVPLVVEPVVPRLRHREAELGVGAAREHRAAEAGDLRREVHRRPHAVDVHVADAGVDVVAAGAHLVEARRLDLPVLASCGRRPR